MSQPIPPPYGAQGGGDPMYPSLGQYEQGHSGPTAPQIPMAQQPVTRQPMQMQQSSTTVVVTQQGLKPSRTWSTGLFGFFQDPFSCFLGLFCPECFACHLANKAGETCLLPATVPCWLLALRAHMRGKHGIQGSISGDCCAIGFCYPCVMCQLSREIDNINTGKAAQ